MKAFKYLVIGALALSAYTPMSAQDLETDLTAISKKVSDANGDPVAVKDDVKLFLKQYKKDPVALAGLGRAYLDAKNLDEAQAYADQVMTLKVKDDKYKTPAYLLAGDIAVLRDDAGTAAMWYQTATMSDPTDDTGYVKYARIYQKIDPDGAVAMLEKLREVKPDYPVDGAAGYMYSATGRLKTAMEYYNKVSDVTSLKDYILYDYASTAYVLEDYDKSLTLAKAGIKTYPEYSSFSRLAFYSNNKLGDYNSSVEYANKLFNKTDTLKFIANDYIYYGDALYKLDRTDEAMEAYKQAQVVDPSRNDVYKMISDVYVKQKKYDKAIDAYDTYIELLGSAANANHYRGYADIYIDQSDTDDEATRQTALKKADDAYADIEAKFDYAVEYAVWKRAAIHYQINPDMQAGEAKPYYERYISIVEPKDEKTQSQLNNLVTSYNYLAVHYIQNDDRDNALAYAQKILAINPNHDTANQIVAAFSEDAPAAEE